MKFGNITIGKQLLVGWGLPEALGKGKKQIRGSAYVEGPLQVGNDKQYDRVEATVMIGEEDNDDALIPAVQQVMDLEDGVDSTQRPSKLSLKVKGNVHIEGDSKNKQTLKINSEAGKAIDINDGTVWIDDSGEAMFAVGTDGMTMSARFSDADGRPKPFDIKHPIKVGWRLRHACIEGPEVGVYYRGRVRNSKEIVLPTYWKGLVHTDSITVQLQPIGAHQDVIIKRWDDQKIHLQARGGMPIDCFYHVYAERKDINPLITEYEGESCTDYPDPNHHSVPYTERDYNDPEYRGDRNTITG